LLLLYYKYYCHHHLCFPTKTWLPISIQYWLLRYALHANILCFCFLFLKQLFFGLWLLDWPMWFDNSICWQWKMGWDLDVVVSVEFICLNQICFESSCCLMWLSIKN
jgi:hypothetical protein